MPPPPGAYPPLVSPPAPAVVAATQGAALAQPYLPRWGVQTGLLQPRQAAFWLFVALLTVTGLMVLTEQLTYLTVLPAGWIFSIILLVLYSVPVVLAIYALDLFEREPPSLLLGAFLWGGVVSIGLAGPMNGQVAQIVAKVFGPQIAITWGDAIVAPPVEETVKLLGVVVIYLIARSEIDDLFDGFVYGAIVGLGFAAVEHVQYFIGAIVDRGGADQFGPVLMSVTARALLSGLYMHVLWTGLTGLGFAYYVTQRDQPRQRRLMYFIGLFALAVVAHFIWNSPLFGELLTGIGGIVMFGLIKGLPFLIFLGLLIVLAQRREHRWFGALTERDTGTDVLTQTELAELGGLRSRWRARRQMAARKGPQAGKLAAQLQREQINLAMIRSRAGSDDDPSVVAQRERIRAIRAQLEAIADLPQPIAPAYGAPTATAGPAVASVAAPAGAAWTPTHVVPATGMAAWSAPDPSQAAVAQLAPGVQLRLLEERGAWAHVMGSNGWTGWVDGRLLVRLA